MESNYTAERIYWTNIYLKQEQHLLGFFLSLHYVLFQICKKLREGHERATRKKVLNCKEQFISLTRESIKICITVTIRNYSNYIKFTQVCFSTATGLQNHMKALQNAICIKKKTPHKPICLTCMQTELCLVWASKYKNCLHKWSPSLARIYELMLFQNSIPKKGNNQHRLWYFNDWKCYSCLPSYYLQSNIFSFCYKTVIVTLFYSEFSYAPSAVRKFQIPFCKICSCGPYCLPVLDDALPCVWTADSAT